MKKKVLAFGVFDCFHKGHEFYLKESSKLGDFLYVLVACDQDVKRVKGQLPQRSEKHRLETIQKLPYVDETFIGQPVKNISDYLRPILEVKPHILALGYDQALTYDLWLRESMKDFKPSPKIVRIKAFKPEIFKSSLLKKNKN